MAESRLIIKAGRLVDGTGDPVQENVAVIAQGRTIREIVPLAAVQPAPGDTVIDATGQTVLPGLIDAHVHILSTGDPGAWLESTFISTTPALTVTSLVNIRKALAMGYTGIRDLACRDQIDIALRDAIEAGEIDGPRLRVSGQGLTMYGGHMAPKSRPEVSIRGSEHHVVNTVDEARSAARYQLAMGVDIVKLNTAGTEYAAPEDGLMCCQEMDYDMILAAVTQAKKIGRLSACHCHGGQGATDSIRAGVKTIEHGHWLTDEQFDLMLEQDAIFVPTFCPNTLHWERGQAGLQKLSYWQEKVIDGKLDTFARAMKKGVKIAAGSDAGTAYNYHDKYARELEFMVDAGMSPLQAIHCSTHVAAETMGLAGQVGTLKPNMWCDVTVVDGDPLADIKVLQEKRRIQVVIKDGQILVDRRGGVPEAVIELELKTPLGSSRGIA